MSNELARMILEGAEKAAKVPPATTLCIDEVGDGVELFIDNKAPVYSEWIKGEGADICLYRDRDTDRVVGCYLPLRYRKLIVQRIKKGTAE